MPKDFFAGGSGVVGQQQEARVQQALAPNRSHHRGFAAAAIGHDEQTLGPATTCLVEDLVDGMESTQVAEGLGDDVRVEPLPGSVVLKPLLAEPGLELSVRDGELVIEQVQNLVAGKQQPFGLGLGRPLPVPVTVLFHLPAALIA
jgi:hypothetical protein